ncbi:hypothetical protein RQP46_005553 [Phenoliferia psychrophenolica]
MTIAPWTPPFLAMKDNYKPTHPDVFLVHFGSEEDYSSCLILQKDFAAGEMIAPIVNTIPGIKKYSSVQVAADPPIGDVDADEASRPRHIELMSDLLYVNHSCDPNVAFEVPASGDWKVTALKDLKKGDTFAYFSTEWSMDQPFHCLCGTPRCIGEVRGAESIPAEVLAKYKLNDHIIALKAHQTGTSAKGKTVA